MEALVEVRLAQYGGLGSGTGALGAMVRKESLLDRGRLAQYGGLGYVGDFFQEIGWPGMLAGD